jgi:hypothetical protein
MSRDRFDNAETNDDTEILLQELEVEDERADLTNNEKDERIDLPLMVFFNSFANLMVRRYFQTLLKLITTSSFRDFLFLSLDF